MLQQVEVYLSSIKGIGQITLKFPKDKAEQRYIVKYLDSLRSKAEELRRLQDETEAGW